jgi:hypothetical protein
MSHISPKPPALAADYVDDDGPWLFSVTQPGWAENAIQFLLDEEDIIVDGVLIRGSDMHPRRPVWCQLRKILKAHGIRTPRLP